MFVSTTATAAFRERLLELVPIYYEAGRAIAALALPTPAPATADLAAAACRRWLVGAIPAGADAMAPVISGLSDEPPALIAFARDVAALAQALDALIRAPARRHALGAAGQARVGAEFAFEANLDQLAQRFGLVAVSEAMPSAHRVLRSA